MTDATRTRTTALAATALALLAVGAGCSHNPGYFPYLIPGGPTVETHGKPGLGYFKNFDPKAAKLEVTPNQLINAPLGSQVVLVGTVVDKDGQPRRSRRIEWMLDGPTGNIVEADESGVFPGRGYKVDNKYAVTYTNYTTKTITRGNTDPGDDVILAAGQTFCVISSSVPGETVVTAYAPEVFNWDCGRVVVKIAWGDNRFSFPQPVVVRSGGEHTLTTVVSATAAEGPPTGYRIRYKVLDGPAAVLVSRGGSGTGTSLSGTGSKEAEAPTDANGEGAVRLVQQSPKAGKTRVAVEVVKPPEGGGTGPGTVVGRKETIVEWAEPKIHMAINAPKAAGLNGTYPVTVALDNEAAVDSREARVKVTLPDRSLFVDSDPPPTSQDAGGTFTFTLPPVTGKSKQEVTLRLQPKKLGDVTVKAEAVTGDGMQAANSVTTRVEQGKLQVHVDAPAVALAGEQIPFKVSVTNPGAATAENVVVWANLDAGLKAATSQNPIELSAGSIAAGQTKVIDLPLTAQRTGKFGVRASATGDGNLSATSEPASVEVRKAELSATATGPKLAYLNQQVTWTVTVSNTGESSVSNVVVRAAVPAEVKVKSAGDGRIGAGSIDWKFPELKAGEQRKLTVTADTLKLASAATLSVSVSGGATSGSRAVGDPVTAKADAPVAIIGTPALALELATPSGVVEVGKRVSYQVRVKNQGTVSARNVEVTAFAPAELRALRATTSNQKATGQIDGNGRVTFPAVDEVRPGETVTFTIEVEATQTGDARFRAEVKAAHLNNTLHEEQSTRVTGK